ncbi:hypothetical protein DPMN_185043 [Dreissena polymorpha]|uniref:Dynein heavy chain ATP-binding dynein motor region domain-containing protein n=1 Tax=Dreissena polymorpha TaxID=45954 RepID=A0A9D4DM03_DREPO|nr:hypothetical protein DPMN_185043 [Dreissena polymorpha]
MSVQKHIGWGYQFNEFACFPSTHLKIIILLIIIGLEAQLLGIVVGKERPDLEEKKDSLVRSIADGKKKLVELEDEILR